METMDNSPSRTRTRRTEHNVSISEECECDLISTHTRRTDANASIMNASITEDPPNTSLDALTNTQKADDAPNTSHVSEDTTDAHAHTQRERERGGTNGTSASRDVRRVHRRTASFDDELCILEDLDMADCETGEIFVDRGCVCQRHSHMYMNMYMF
jgi:hypothetical protein